MSDCYFFFFSLWQRVSGKFHLKTSYMDLGNRPKLVYSLLCPFVPNWSPLSRQPFMLDKASSTNENPLAPGS